MYYLLEWEMMNIQETVFLPQMMNLQEVYFCPFLVLMTIWETLQETLEPSVLALTSEKLVLIFKFIYKP